MPTQKMFVYTDVNGEQITEDKMDNNRYRCLLIEEHDMLAQWHLQWHIPFRPFLLLFVCLGKCLKKLKKKKNYLNVKHKL